MDPHSFIARAEAHRWLDIAEKLLMNRDLVGSKTFAIRARESDPRLELPNQILAIVDTLLAADKRVGANNNQPDWYSILQLVRLTHDSELIASQYRRLALLLNPSQTQLPYADQAFQLVSEAWSVLSNPMRKSIYDNELNFSEHQQFNPIEFTREFPPPQQQNQYQHHHQQPAPPPPPQQQQHNFFSPQNVVGSSREQERPERPFVIRPHQQHNFLSQPNLVGSGHEPEQQTRPSFQSKPTQQQQQQNQQQRQVQQRPPPPQQPQPQPLHASPPAQSQIQSQSQPSFPPAAPQRQQPVPPPQQQPQEPNRPTPAVGESSNGVREERTDDRNGDGSSKFWTACPFCFNMYEFFKVYAECTLRCQNCKRAFQAVEVQSPPLVSEGGEEHYYCWGFFPLGISKPSFEKNKGNGSSWAPFSAMFAGPKFSDFQYNLKPKRNYYKGPRVYIDDVVDDVFAGLSEPSDDSDIAWGSIRKKKKAKRPKTVKSGTRKKGSGRKKGSLGKKKQAMGVNVAEGVRMGNGENGGEGFPVQEGVVVPNVSVADTSKKAETSKKAVGTVPRRQSGRVAKELGKLDLNVEFNNNDGEEPAPGMTAGNRGGHREEDNIEGIGFFEGLDEFLSSLPILSVVGDDKVKAA